MKKVSQFVMTFLLLGFFVLSCDLWENSDSPEPGENSIYQIGGCAGNLGLRKAASRDSCFSWEFGNQLWVEFCVTANCCPDSNRFDLEYKISGNTIFVAVEDTARNLCRCICPYIIHLELHNLPLNHYYFKCTYGDELDYDEEIWRKF